MGGAAGAAGGPPDAGQATCDLSCPAHQTCVVQGNTPTCACVAGYQLSGNDCVWGTVPQDPGFQDVPDGAWTIKAGAMLVPAAAGYLDPGQLVFPKSGPCSRSGALQSITMPTVAQAEPLAVKISADADCISSQGPGCWPPDTAVVINGGVITFNNQPSSIVNSACLGERAYGGTFDLEVRPLGWANCVVAHTDAIVDHVDIEPSATCPVPGTVPDGDFDGTLNTWGTWTGSSGIVPESIAEIAPALGTDGSSAAHLWNSNDCQDAEVGEWISPPLSVPNLALQFSFKGTVGAAITVTLDSLTLGTLSGTGAQASAHVCLLEANKGMTQSLGVWLQPVWSLRASGACTPIAHDFVVDDFKFVSDPSCAATAYIADGGFERTDAAMAWDSTPQTGIDTTAANVHGGKRAMKMVNTTKCGTARVSFPVTVPPSATGAGPALQFFYKAPVLAYSDFSVTIGGSLDSGLLPAATGYTRAQICLDPTWTGQSMTIEATLAGKAAGTCASIPTETAWLDDFTVTTSGDCPAQ